MAKKNHMKTLRAEAKKNPAAKSAQEAAEHSDEIANGPGISSGNPHQIPQDIRDPSPEKSRRKRSRFPLTVNPLPAIGGGVTRLGQGVIGGVKGAGRGVVGGVSEIVGGVKRVGRGVDGYFTETEGFVPDLANHPPTAGVSYEERTTPRGLTLMGSNGQAKVRERSEGRSRSPREEHAPPLPMVDTTVADRQSKRLSTDGAVDGPKKRPFWKRESTKISDEYKIGDEDEAHLSLSPTAATITDDEKKTGKKSLDVYPSHGNEQYVNEDWGEPLWKKYVPEKKRPTSRLPLHKWLPALPLIGKKVDTISYCRKELARLNVEIEQDQENHEAKFPLMNSAFIQFNQQVAAHMACQAVSHHVPQHMTPRHIEVSPNDVIWGNMKMQWWERYLRKAAIMVVTGALIIGWAIPVAFVGLLSQIDTLTSTFGWLAWLKDLPRSVLGLISGVLPAVLLGALMAVLPIILRRKCTQFSLNVQY